MGDLSKHFDSSEFQCGHCGRLDVLSGELVNCLERLRALVGKPLPIVSGYRCCEGNRSVGGTKYSQHLFGRAADIPAGYATVAQCKEAGFAGIGVRAGKVVHVDLTPFTGKPWTKRRAFTFKD